MPGMKKNIIIISVLFFSIILILIITTNTNYFKEEGSGNSKILSPHEWAWLSKYDGTITLASDPSYPPVAFIDKKGNHKGIAADYFELIEKKLNFTFKRINLSTWAEVLQKGRERKLDLFGGATKTSERSKHFLFTQPYLDIPTIIIVRNSIKKNMKLPDLKGKKITVGKGYAVEEYLNSNYGYLKIHPVKNDLEGFKMVSLNQAYAHITDLPSASYYISKHGITNLRIAGDTGYTMKIAIAVRKDMPQLNQILIKTIATFTDNERATIYDKMDQNRIQQVSFL